MYIEHPIFLFLLCIVLTIGEIWLIVTCSKLQFKVGYYERKFLWNKHKFSAEEWAKIKRVLDM